MKKFIISKIDNDRTNTISPPHVQQPPPPPLEAKQEVPSPVDLMPPPPPPPDDPPPDLSMLSRLEYQKIEEDLKNITHQEPMMIDDVKPEPPPPPRPHTSTIMCRDFVRGTCKRPGTCRYAHKCDTSQLVGVYTFCRNYQNKTCELTNCKYVHATIFEEQYFYRTGKLPPHVLVHKKVEMRQPPPPPPPLTPPCSPPPPPRMEIPAMFTCPPPPLYTPSMPSTSAPPPVMCLPVPDMAMYHHHFPVMAMPPPVQEMEKCKYCDLTQFRLEHQQNKVAKRRKTIDDLKDDALLLSMKNRKLNKMLLMMLKLRKTTASVDEPGTSSDSMEEKKLMGNLQVAAMMAAYFNERPDSPLSNTD